MKKWICAAVCVLVLMVPAPAAAAAEEVSTVPCSHSVSEWQSGGDTSHTGVCSLCGQTQTGNHSWGEPAGPDATCTAAGEKTCSCTVCGATKTETIAATGHSFGEWTDADDTNHKRICSKCGTEEVQAHTQTSEKVTLAAGCTTDGKKDLLCSCGHIITRDVTIPKTGHDYGSWSKGAEGHSRSCKNCGEEELAAHKFDKVAVVKAATCKEEGKTTKTCSTCGYTTDGEPIAKLTTHTYDNSCDDTCNVCGEKRKAGHKFSTAWSSDGVGHWHACTVCKEKKDEGRHVPGPAATEESDQVCLTCKYVMTPKKTHVHSYEKAWSMDEKGHWHACTGCDTQKEFTAHVYDNSCDEACNVCGYLNQKAHTFSYSHTTERVHQAVCSVCGKKQPSESHVPGPAATELQPQLCTVCGYVLNTVQEHVHDFGNVWLNNGQSHWQECQCGEQSIPQPHSWDAGKEEKGGKIHFTCTQCGLERTELKDSSGFPWWIVFAVLGILLVGGAGVAVYLLKVPVQLGKFSKK